MRTVLVIEDQFLESFELEYQLRKRGYEVQHTATVDGGIQFFRSLEARGELAAIICDNRLIGGAPAATFIYRQVRSVDPKMPFIIYSGFPPQDLPSDDPLLAIVLKPFTERVLSLLSQLAPPPAQGRPVGLPELTSDAA